ncbi:MAG: hypothetical protein R3230_01835 [Nitrosopumilaceae archaeon]|nr:hypothetical protein [Nitrosopumilaceae archaeon]
MTQSLEPLLDQFYEKIQEQSPVLDPDLAIRVMQISRSLNEISPTRSKPHVNLYIKYKDGVSYSEKVNEMRDKYPIQSAVSRWGDGVIASGLMSIKNVQTICSDPDIVEVKGKTSARHN